MRFYFEVENEKTGERDQVDFDVNTLAELRDEIDNVDAGERMKRLVAFGLNR